jgi:hypothetical protein
MYTHHPSSRDDDDYDENPSVSNHDDAYHRTYPGVREQEGA